MSLKSKLNKFFREMRAEGYFAKQNLECCQSCGWAVVPEEKKKMAIFYHGQDKADMSDGSVHISWAGKGKDICRIANNCGLETIWTGNQNHRIRLVEDRQDWNKVSE